MTQRQRLKFKEAVDLDRISFVTWIENTSEGKLILFCEDQRVWTYQFSSIDAPILREIGNCDFTVTCIDLLKREIDENRTNDRALLSCTDGCWRIMNMENMKAETIVQAHSEAVVSAKWTKHGTTIVSCGVDGSLKLWSTKGILRTILIELSSSICQLTCALDAFHLAFTSFCEIYILDLRQTKRVRRFSSRKAPVLTLEWSPIDLVLASGYEDGIYELYNEKGTKLFSSETMDSRIDVLKWSPNGNQFLIATDRSLFFCSHCGPILSKIPLIEQSVLDLCPTGKGRWAVAHLDRLSIYDTIQSAEIENLSGALYTQLTDAINRYDRAIGLDSEVTNVGRGHGFVIATTTHHCYIFEEDSSAEIDPIEIKAAIRIVKQSSQCFLLVSQSGSIVVYDYEGHPKCILDVSANLVEKIQDNQIDISSNEIVIALHNSSPTIHVFQATTGIEMGRRSIDVEKIHALISCQWMTSNGRALAIIDGRHTLYLLKSFDAELLKLNSFVKDAHWHRQHDLLAVLTQTELAIWHFASLLDAKTSAIDGIHSVLTAHIPQNAIFDRFEGMFCSIRSENEGTFHFTIDPKILTLHQRIQTNKPTEALSFCRRFEDPSLWKLFAAKALIDHEWTLADLALKALNHIEVAFL